MKYKKYQILDITWIDANQTTDWQDPDYELPSDLGTRTVGYFWKETEDYIAVLQSYTTDHTQIDAIMQIPKVTIKEIKQM